MLYNLTLQCGCVVRVWTQPNSRVAPKRVIESHGRRCTTARHRAGAQLYLWDMLPSRVDRLRLLRAELDDDAQWTA